MSSPSTLRTSKSREWWINFFLGGDFDGLFIYDPEFLHVTQHSRKQAAGRAVNASWSSWKFWRALMFIGAIIAILAFVESTFHLSRGIMTPCVVLGALLGLYSLRWAIYQSGIPVYRRMLSGFNQAEQGGAGQPATRSQSDSEGNHKPQSGSEGHPR